MAETIKGINVIIGSETSGLQAALSDVNKKSKDIQGELKQVEKLLKLDPTNTELIAQKQKLLGDAVANTKEKLDRLKATQEQVNEQFARGDITEGQYRAFQREVIATGEELSRLEEQVRINNSSLLEFGNKAKEAGEKVSKAGEGLTKGVTVPLLAAGAGLVAVGGQFDDAFDGIRIGTGATGDALEALNEDFRKVASEVPASFDDVSTAIADYNTRLGLAGEGLQDLSKQTLQLENITGDDLGATIESTSQSFRAFNVPAKDYGDSLDYIFKVSQSTGIGIDRIQQNLVKFAPALKQLGLGFEESATLMGQLDKAGVDVEQTMSALTKAVSNMAKDGITNAGEAVQILFDKIKNAPSDMAGAQEALKTFGAKAGPGLATAIREGKLEYTDLLKTLQASDETIIGVADETADWAEGLTKLKNNALLAVEPIAGELFGAINDLIPLLKGALEVVAGLIQKFTELPEGTQKTILVIAGLVAALGPVLIIIGKVIAAVGAIASGFSAASGAVAAAGGAMAVITGPIGIAIAIITTLAAAAFLIIKNWEPIKEFFITLWETISTWTINTWDTIKQVLEDTWNAIKTTAETVWNALVEGVKAIILPFVEMIRTNFQGMFDGLRTIFEGIKTYFTGVWEVIKNIFLGAILLIIDLVKGDFGRLKTDAEAIFNNLKVAFSQIWEGIKLVFTGALQAISGYISGAWNTIKALTSTVWEGIRIVLGGIFDGVKTSAQVIFDTIVNIIKSAIDFIKQLPSQMLEFGKNIIQGLIDGIKSMAGAVGNAISNIADKVTGGIRDALGIHSPSRVMMEMGSYTGEGFALGIQSTIGEISKASSAMARAVNPNVSSGTISTSPGRTESSNGIVQNITVQSPKALNPSETARQVKNASRILAMEW